MRNLIIPGLAIPGLALAIALAAVPASAQDADARFSVVGGVTMLTPSDPGDGLRVEGDTAASVSASWFANDHVAIELWGVVGSDKLSHSVRRDGVGRIGNVKQQPVALSGQWHFGDAADVFRPFVGIGYYESNFTRENLGGDLHVGLQTAKGAIGTAGIDFNISPTWFVRVDARYLQMRPDVRVAGTGTGEEVDLDPWAAGIGFGGRF